MYIGCICRCVKVQENVRFLVKPDVIRRMDELKKLANDVESRVSQVRPMRKNMPRLRYVELPCFTTDFDTSESTLQQPVTANFDHALQLYN